MQIKINSFNQAITVHKSLQTKYETRLKPSVGELHPYGRRFKHLSSYTVDLKPNELKKLRIITAILLIVTLGIAMCFHTFREKLGVLKTKRLFIHISFSTKINPVEQMKITALFKPKSQVPPPSVQETPPVPKAPLDEQEVNKRIVEHLSELFHPTEKEYEKRVKEHLCFSKLGSNYTKWQEVYAEYSNERKSNRPDEYSFEGYFKDHLDVLGLFSRSELKILIQDFEEQVWKEKLEADFCTSSKGSFPFYKSQYMYLLNQKAIACDLFSPEEKFWENKLKTEGCQNQLGPIHLTWKSAYLNLLNEKIAAKILKRFLEIVPGDSKAKDNDYFQNKMKKEFCIVQLGSIYSNWQEAYQAFFRHFPFDISLSEKDRMDDLPFKTKFIKEYGSKVKSWPFLIQHMLDARVNLTFKKLYEAISYIEKEGRPNPFFTGMGDIVDTWEDFYQAAAKDLLGNEKAYQEQIKLRHWYKVYQQFFETYFD